VLYSAIKNKLVFYLDSMFLPLNKMDFHESSDPLKSEDEYSNGVKKEPHDSAPSSKCPVGQVGITSGGVKHEEKDSENDDPSGNGSKY